MTNDMFIQLKIILRQFYGDVNHFYFISLKRWRFYVKMCGAKSKMHLHDSKKRRKSPSQGAFRRSNSILILCISLQIRMQIQHLLLRDPCLLHNPGDHEVHQQVQLVQIAVSHQIH